MVGLETVGLSGSQFGLAVEALDHAARVLAFGSEPVEDKRSMASPPGDLVDAKRLGPRPIQALPTIGHRHLDRTKDDVPAAVLRYLLFQDSLRPARQKPGVGRPGSSAACRPPTVSPPPVSHSPDFSPAAAHRPGTRSSPKAGRGRSAGPPIERNPAPLRPQPEHTGGQSYWYLESWSAGS
jgi:hypothetical protein